MSTEYNVVNDLSERLRLTELAFQEVVNDHWALQAEFDKVTQELANVTLTKERYKTALERIAEVKVMGLPTHESLLAIDALEEE